MKIKKWLVCVLNAVSLTPALALTVCFSSFCYTHIQYLCIYQQRNTQAKQIVFCQQMEVTISYKSLCILTV
jgi:hypothetical protein